MLLWSWVGGKNWSQCATVCILIVSQRSMDARCSESSFWCVPLKGFITGPKATGQIDHRLPCPFKPWVFDTAMETWLIYNATSQNQQNSWTHNHTYILWHGSRIVLSTAVQSNKQKGMKEVKKKRGGVRKETASMDMLNTAEEWEDLPKSKTIGLGQSSCSQLVWFWLFKRHLAMSEDNLGCHNWWSTTGI